MQGKIFTSIDGLFYVGLMKHQPGISYNLAKKLSDAAIKEYGSSEIYPVLAEKFTEVVMKERSSGQKKSFLVSQIKPSKKALTLGNTIEFFI